MRLVFGLVLVLGVALAGFAVYMAQDFIAQAQSERDRLAAEAARAPKLVDIVVANKPLKYGDRFTRADLEIVRVEAGKVPPERDQRRRADRAAGWRQGDRAGVLGGRDPPPRRAEKL